MSMTFRWYLSKSSGWANRGEGDRKLDYQIWCGPAIGSFNDFIRGSYLDPKVSKQYPCVVQINLQLLTGACYLRRLQSLTRCEGLKTDLDELGMYSVMSSKSVKKHYKQSIRKQKITRIVKIKHNIFSSKCGTRFALASPRMLRDANTNSQVFELSLFGANAVEPRFTPPGHQTSTFFSCCQRRSHIPKDGSSPHYLLSWGLSRRPSPIWRVRDD